MAFNGTLLTIQGTTNYPMNNKLLAQESYSCVRHVLDSNSSRDARGVLKRGTLPNVPLEISISTIDGITEAEKESIMNAIRMRYTNPYQRELMATFFVPELGTYVSQRVYLSDPSFVIKELKGNKLTYKAFTLKFIGY